MAQNTEIFKEAAESGSRELKIGSEPREKKRTVLAGIKGAKKSALQPLGTLFHCYSPLLTSFPLLPHPTDLNSPVIANKVVLLTFPNRKRL
jgi:hypothetical protein